MEVDSKEEFGQDRPGWYFFKIEQHAKNQTVTFHITNAKLGERTCRPAGFFL